MKLADLIGIDRILVGVRAADKAQALGEIARRAATQVATEASTILAALVARERLGSTGFGRGFALPHARIEGLAQLHGLFVRLARPVDFEAIDGQAVDLMFVLLIPPDKNSEHVAALAAVARAMRDEETLRAIRKAPNPAAIFALLSAPGT